MCLKRKDLKDAYHLIYRNNIKAAKKKRKKKSPERRNVWQMLTKRNRRRHVWPEPTVRHSYRHAHESLHPTYISAHIYYYIFIINVRSTLYLLDVNRERRASLHMCAYMLACCFEFFFFFFCRRRCCFVAF